MIHFMRSVPITGIYSSQLVALGLEEAQRVTLVGEGDDGWWFELPDSWPYEPWRGNVRWFSKSGSTFAPLPATPTPKEPTQND